MNWNLHTSLKGMVNTNIVRVFYMGKISKWCEILLLGYSGTIDQIYMLDFKFDALTYSFHLIGCLNWNHMGTVGIKIQVKLVLCCICFFAKSALGSTGLKAT